MHETSLVIRSTQVDIFGHLNNAAYLEVFEWARWEWAAARGMDALQWAEARRLGPVVLHVDLTFQREVRMLEPVVIRTWFEKLERVRGVLGQELYKADGVLGAQMWLTFAIVDLERRRVAPMPPEMTAAFTADAAYRESREALPQRRRGRPPDLSDDSGARD